MLQYVEIGGDKLMFFSPDRKAFGSWWFLGFFGVIAVLIVFTVLFYRILKQDEDDRYSAFSVYRKIVKSFKEEFWFWEFILFSRRFFVALFTSIQFVGGDYTNFIFLIILIIYLCLQIHFKPFAFKRVNRVESLCLILLIAAFSSANFVNDNDLFVSWILSFCILIPLLMIIFYILKYFYQRYKMREYDDDGMNMKNGDDMIDEEKVNKMLKRMPKSYQEMTSMSNVSMDNMINSDGDNNEDQHIEMVENGKENEAVLFASESVDVNIGNNENEQGMNLMIKNGSEIQHQEKDDVLEEKDDEIVTGNNGEIIVNEPDT